MNQRRFFIHEKFDPYYFRYKLSKAFSKKTAHDPNKWDSNIPSTGHCYVVSELISVIFDSSEFYVTKNHDNTHWFYKIDEEFFDFTSDQYGGDGIKPLKFDFNNKQKQNILPQDSSRSDLFKKRFSKVSSFSFQN